MSDLGALIEKLERALWAASVSGNRDHFHALAEAVREAIEVLREKQG